MLFIGDALKRRVYLYLWLLGAVMMGVTAAIQRVPGTMDADYYYASAILPASGRGWVEPFIWNYLSAPGSLPQPAYTYWMPLASLLAALGMWVFQSDAFWAARAVFLILASLLPPFAAWVAFRITRRGWAARFAGLLALFPGYYLAYFNTTETFLPYIYLGGAFVVWAFDEQGEGGALAAGRWLRLGFLAGLMHLARADGGLWLAAAVLVAWVSAQKGQKGRAGVGRWVQNCACIGGAYLVCMGPWLVRNLMIFGQPLPPAGSHTLWLQVYEETFLYPASGLTWQHWLDSGLQNLVWVRIEALGLNLQTMLAVQGQVILLPFALIGGWQRRSDPRVKLAGAMWLATLGVMTLVFPFAGRNGGFFHSGAAVQTMIWALAGLGVERVVTLLAQWRNWKKKEQAFRVIRGILVGVCALMTLAVYSNRVIGSGLEAPPWDQSWKHYQAVEQRLAALGFGPEQGVLVNNPPGYYAATHRPAIVIPYGDKTMLLAAARAYGLQLVVLEVQNPEQLGPLYHNAQMDPDFELLGAVDTTLLLRVRNP